jgi:hypothetical protein
MNTKELEALVIAQGAELRALEKKVQANLEAHMHLVQRADNIVEGFKKELAARDERIEQLSTDLDQRVNSLLTQLGIMNEAMDKLVDQGEFEQVRESMQEHRSHQDGMNDTLFGAISRIEKLETLVLARNASAATKRNMTDEDALRVLTGDLRDMPHKEAAEKIGLTYAQVYSCRLEFTFKHVHKDLRDNVKEWKNPWSK